MILFMLLVGDPVKCSLKLQTEPQKCSPLLGPLSPDYPFVGLVGVYRWHYIIATIVIIMLWSIEVSKLFQLECTMDYSYLSDTSNRVGCPV